MSYLRESAQKNPMENLVRLTRLSPLTRLGLKNYSRKTLLNSSLSSHNHNHNCAHVVRRRRLLGLRLQLL